MAAGTPSYPPPFKSSYPLGVILSQHLTVTGSRLEPRLSFGTIVQEAASVTYKILKRIICGQKAEAR
jgi:hypothetical protein